MGFLDGRERRFGLGNKKPPLPLGEGSKGLLLLACVLIGLLSSVAFAAEPSRDERFLAGLRERGLHELAETYCRDRLTQPDLSPRDRAELTIQWTRTLAQHAVNAPPEARGPVWRQAQQVVDDFLRRHPQNPRRRLVRLQGALAHLARGELGRQESEIVPNGQPTLDEARSELHAAIRELEALADEVDAALRASATRPDERTDRLTADELASLGKNVQYQLARARRNQGLCFAAASADRTNSLTRAVELLAPLTKLDSADPLAWKSRVDQIVCYRLLADHAAASRMLEALTARKPPSAIGLRAQAERIRLALDAGRLAEALAMLELPRRLEGITSPQLDYARLEACLAGWRAASQSGNNAGAQRWQTLAGKMLRQIETEHGLYWTRRGEMLLAGVFQTAVESGDLETLVRAAKSFYLSGRLDDALAGYDRAATMAAEQGSDARALELAYVAAMIQQKRGRHRDAMTRCRRAAMAMPRADKASETHLQAIRNAAEVAKSKAAGSLDRYAQMLEEHLQTWPGSTTANQARWWLGRLRQHRRDWPRAIEAYSRISADDANRPAAVAAVAQCYQAWIGARRASDQSTAELATQGAGWFESVIVAPEGGLPSRWSPLAREAALPRRPALARTRARRLHPSPTDTLRRAGRSRRRAAGVDILRPSAAGRVVGRPGTHARGRSDARRGLGRRRRVVVGNARRIAASGGRRETGDPLGTGPTATPRGRHARNTLEPTRRTRATGSRTDSRPGVGRRWSG